MIANPQPPIPNPGTVVIGTRGSALAVWQAEHVARRLQEVAPGLETRLERIQTSGDRIQDVPLAQVGGKALFVKEIEEALLEGHVDLAVHSMKDLPADIPAGLAIAAVLTREDPSDVIISRSGAGVDSLPSGGRIGTSSLRRRSQLLHRRPDLRVLPLRGNLDTRIRKLSSEGLDAIVVARAGVRRLGLEHLVTEVLPPEILLPAVGQGALGIEVRDQRSEIRDQQRSEARGQGVGARFIAPDAHSLSPSQGERGRVRGVSTAGDADIAQLVRSLDHDETHLAVRAERALLRRLGGGCQVPIAALATIEGATLTLRGLVAGLEGEHLVRAESRAPADDPEGLGARVAEDLLARGASEILRAISGAAR